MRRRAALLASVSGVLLIAALAAPLSASAHALAQSSVPAAGAVLNQSPATVVITFGEAPDPKLSTISVVDSSSVSWTSGPTTPVPGNPLELQVSLKPLPHGVYTVAWRTVSSVDGHLAAGSFAFGVGVAASSVASVGVVASPPPSAMAIAGRLLLFAGLMLVVGVAFIALLVFPQPRRLFTGLLAAGTALAVAGTALVTEAQRAAAGVAWGDVFGTSLGTTLLERSAFAGLLVIATAATALRIRKRLYRAVLLGAAVFAFGAMAVDVFSSHAGAESPVGVNELLQWLHIAAAGVWIGGLAALLLAVRGLPSADKARGVRRFSLVAGFALLVVAVTGTVRAILEVTTFSALFSTAFGQLVIIKVALLVVLIGLGAVNRWRNVPSAAGRLRGLRVVGSTELVVATAALLVAAALVNVSPPVAAAAARAAQPKPLVLNGSDQATTVKVRLTVSPGIPGFNTFMLTVKDYDSGAPVTPQVVKLSFASVDTPTVGGSTLVLRRTGAGAFSGQGANLSLAGRWRIQILLEQGAASTEVDVQATVTSPPPKVDVQRFGNGLPTLYTVHLTEGRTVQIYFDPDHPGATNFHATFFDARGQELPISSIAMTVGKPGSTLTTLTPQRLDPGHFVAPVTLPSGSSHFTVVATTTTGEQLAAAVDLTPGSH